MLLGPERPFDRVPAAQLAATASPDAAAGCQARSFAALLRVHVVIRHLQIAVVDAIPITPTDCRARLCRVSRVRGSAVLPSPPVPKAGCRYARQVRDAFAAGAQIGQQTKWRTARAQRATSHGLGPAWAHSEGPARRNRRSMFDWLWACRDMGFAGPFASAG
jgi:hypothetical protein